MQPATTIDFASAARALTREARRRGLIAPSYRCPPRLVGIDRSIRRRAGADAVVAVRMSGRPRVAMLADMIEGVIATNQLRPPHADRVRAELWIAVDSLILTDDSLILTDDSLIRTDDLTDILDDDSLILTDDLTDDNAGDPNDLTAPFNAIAIVAPISGAA